MIERLFHEADDVSNVPPKLTLLSEPFGGLPHFPAPLSFSTMAQKSLARMLVYELDERLPVHLELLFADAVDFGKGIEVGR